MLPLTFTESYVVSIAAKPQCFEVQHNTPFRIKKIVAPHFLLNRVRHAKHAHGPFYTVNRRKPLSASASLISHLVRFAE